MPAHIIRRKDCGGTFYLIDGELTKSLKTKTRRYAEVLLRGYLDGKHNLGQTPTVQQFYEKWIERKIEPLVRRSQIRDYRQAFGARILPRFKDKCLAEIGTGELKDFQIELLKKGLAVKTCRNIIDGSFRAMYRDAKAEIPEIAGRDPFMDALAESAARASRPVQRRGAGQNTCLPRRGGAFLFSVRVFPVSNRMPSVGINRAHMGGLKPRNPHDPH